MPVCLLAGVLLVRNFSERVERRDHRVDYAGAVLLTASMTLVILGVLEGGQAWAWSSTTSLAVFSAGGALLVAFVLAERRAAEPVLPLWVLRRRLLLTTSLLSLGVGVILIGLTSYVPIYLESSVGSPPIVAGLALASLTIGWPLASTFSGRLLYQRYGFRPTVLVGMGLAIVGAGTLALFAHTPTMPLVALSCFVMGLGMGLVAAPSLIAAQSSVEWDERGVVTGTNMFARSIGSAVGIAVFGAVANAVIAAHGGETHAAAVTEGSAAVFLAVLVAALVTVVAAISMPSVRADGGSGVPHVKAPAASPATR